MRNRSIYNGLSVNFISTLISRFANQVVSGRRRGCREENYYKRRAETGPISNTMAEIPSNFSSSSIWSKVSNFIKFKGIDRLSNGVDKRINKRNLLSRAFPYKSKQVL